LPISLLDIGTVVPAVEIRYGRENEKYIFNATGQEIELAGLICVCGKQGGECSPSIPMGNPVKDSMAGKIKDHTTGVVGVVYGTTAVLNASEMDRLLIEFSRLLERYASATDVERRVASGRASDR
jgi:DNA/RNA-binding domain of Phe-tRNA-synthetase-like protein